MKNEFINQINSYLPNVDYCSFRFVSKYTNVLSVTRNVLEPIEIIEDEGLMVTVIHNGGYGYSATSDLTREGILKATEEAKSWSAFTEMPIWFNCSCSNIYSFKETTFSYCCKYFFCSTDIYNYFFNFFIK